MQPPAGPGCCRGRKRPHLPQSRTLHAMATRTPSRVGRGAGHSCAHVSGPGLTRPQARSVHGQAGTFRQAAVCTGMQVPRDTQLQGDPDSRGHTRMQGTHTDSSHHAGTCKCTPAHIQTDSRLYTHRHETGVHVLRNTDLRSPVFTPMPPGWHHVCAHERAGPHCRVCTR